ncbi:MAG: hypothetical protein Q7V57_13395 [Actinomycetota bacterium]|nr:hypothetical protein [Actinomycetota bacterium]
MAAQAWFSRGEIDVTPGSVAVVQLTVVNLADTTDSFVLTPAGMAAGWTTIEPATITLFGGTQQEVEVHVTPPLLPSTTAGPTSLSVRVVSQRDPDEARSAETVLNIAASHQRRLDVLQPAQRGRYAATYEMMLENRGNTQATCRMHLIDPSGRVEADFDPPTAGVEPGASTLVRARVRARGLQWERRPRTVNFRLDADEPGSPTASASAMFVQAPVVPERLAGVLMALIGLAAVGLLSWVAVVRPAVRDAARDAVADALPSTTSVVGATPDDPDATNPPSTTPGDEVGQIANIPLPVTVAVGQTDSKSFTVPTGQRLLVTDIVVQNPNADQGTLLVQRNSVTLYSFRLDNILGDTSVPLVTPIEFLAGEQLVVTVTCRGVGDPTIATCAQNVFASGRLLAD